MNYPSTEEVEQASQLQLGKWMRFLPSPGMNAIQNDGATGEALEAIREKEQKILDLIMDRFYGWTPELSKSVGW